MPVAKGPSFDLRSALVFGGIAVLAAIVIGLIAIELGTRSNTLVLGSTDFGQINVDRMAESIAEGGPVLFPDIASGSRDIWLQHLGDDPGDGWFAFDTRLPGEGRECFADWVASEQIFRNVCDGTVYPKTARGLPAIPCSSTAPTSSSTSTKCTKPAILRATAADPGFQYFKSEFPKLSAFDYL